MSVSVSLWLCGSVALWLRGSVALWLWLYLSLCLSLSLSLSLSLPPPSGRFAAGQEALPAAHHKRIIPNLGEWLMLLTVSAR